MPDAYVFCKGCGTDVPFGMHLNATDDTQWCSYACAASSGYTDMGDGTLRAPEPEVDDRD